MCVCASALIWMRYTYIQCSALFSCQKQIAFLALPLRLRYLMRSRMMNGKEKRRTLQRQTRLEKDERREQRAH